MKELKKTTILCPQTQTLNIVKFQSSYNKSIDSIYPRSKFLQGFLKVLNFIWEGKGIRIIKNNTEKEKQVEFKTYCKITVIKIIRVLVKGQTHRSGQLNR
jgi:hypothetical protein